MANSNTIAVIFSFDFAMLVGSINARSLAVGQLFQLLEHPRDNQNREYLVVSANYKVTGHEIQSDQADDDVLTCEFRVIESRRPYRPLRSTLKPTVKGPQTATVVGKSGEEIWTDKYGRVKVKFHWDRLSSGDENSSCWVRVAQVWAGSHWGAMHIPRIGQEVIIDFLEGDPDQPIITGRVYNADNMPPYALPGNQTQSGIKSRSTKDGGEDNFNEIRFEDKKGAEELFIQAEKNQTTNVKNDQSVSVKNNQSVSVGGNRSVSVKGNESISVSGERSVSVTKKDTESFSDARAVTVALTDTLTVTGKHTGTYNGERSVTVKTMDSTTVIGNHQQTVQGKSQMTADQALHLGQRANTIVLQDGIVAVAPTVISLQNDPSNWVGLAAGGNITINAGTQLTLQCGDASITLKKDGSVELRGKVIDVGALGEGSAGAVFDSAGATISGKKISSSATGAHEITGMVVKIN